MSNKKTLFLVATSFAAFCVGVQPAWAQAKPADGGEGLTDIVVTALKRTEKLQDTPSTVNVVTGQDIVERGLTDVRGISNLAPAIQLNAENTATQVFIRGIGQSSDGDSNSPAVAVNFDGVYTPRYAVGTSMFDVAQVEILPGPQGLLYGRNAAGGAINVNTRKPGDHFQANGLVEVGNYGLVHVSAGMDIPVSDTLSLRAAVDRVKHDGYLSDGQNDANSIAGRLTALWRPSDGLSVLIRGEISHLGGNGAAIIAHPFINPKDPWYNPTAPGDNFYNHEIVRKVSAEITYDLGGATITYIPAFTYYSFGYRTPLSVPVLAPALLPLAVAPYGGLLSNGQPGGYFAAALVVPRDAQKQYSNELRIASNNNGQKAAGTLSWLAGLYQIAGNTNLNPGDGVDIYNPAAASGGSITPYTAVTWGGANVERHDNHSYAAFGQLSYAVTDGLRFTGGLRYSIDRQHTDGVSQTYLPATPLFVIPFSHGALVNYNGVTATAATSFNLRKTDHKVDWKVGAEFDVAPTSLLYASVQTGYNQGGFNLSRLTTFEPEHLLAFTAGSKNSFLNNRLVLNGEAFFYNYNNLQVASFDATSGTGFRVNVPRSVIYGTQIDASYKITSSTLFSASVVFLDAHISRGVLGPAATYGGSTQYPTCAAPIASTLCAGGGNIDYAGYTLDHAPPVSAVISLRQNLDFSSGARIEGFVGTHIDAASWGLYSHVPGTRLPAYAITDLSLTFYPAGGRWNIAAWVKNVGNTARLEALATDSIYGQTPASIQPPRTFGGRIGFNFGG